MAGSATLGEQLGGADGDIFFSNRSAAGSAGAGLRETHVLSWSSTLGLLRELGSTSFVRDPAGGVESGKGVCFLPFFLAMSA